MTRRDILRTTVGAASAVGLAGVAAAAPRRLRNVGIASPGIGARVRAEGPDFDIIEYCNSLGLGAAHIYLRGDAGPDTLAKMREQLNKYDMRITISVRTPQSDDELPQYESTIKALSEMDGRVYCILEQYSGRRYEQFKTAEEANRAVAVWKEASWRAEPILRKYKMKLAIENHKGYRSNTLVDWIRDISSEYIGVCFDMCNNATLVETAQQTYEALAPYTFFVSFKDLAVDFYDEGVLVSEVGFGDGLYDLPAVVERLQRNDPNMIFQLEMITRDPLKAAIFTPEYWHIWNDEAPVPPQDVALFVDWVRKNPPKKPLPMVSGLTPEQQLALEDQLNQQCLDYIRANLPTL